MASRKGCRPRKVKEEAGSEPVDRKLQYCNQPAESFLIEPSVMEMTVSKVKEDLLSLNNLSYIRESADQLDLHLILESGPKKMDDSKRMSEYRTEIFMCSMFKLLPKNT